MMSAMDISDLKERQAGLLFQTKDSSLVEAYTLEEWHRGNEDALEPGGKHLPCPPKKRPQDQIHPAGRENLLCPSDYYFAGVPAVIKVSKDGHCTRESSQIDEFSAMSAGVFGFSKVVQVCNRDHAD